MPRIPTHRLSVWILMILAITLITLSWMLAQLGSCWGDIKAGSGDIRTVSMFEMWAFFTHLLGIVSCGVALLVHHFQSTGWFWVKASLIVLLSPFAAFVTWMGLVLLGGPHSWLCGLAY